MNALTAIGSNLVYGYISTYILDFVMDDMSDRMTFIMGQLYLMPKDAQRRLIALDLSHKLVMIKSVLQTLKTDPQGEAISEIIHRISGILKSIDTKMMRHKEKMLWRWRDPGIGTDLEDIELHTQILMNRFNMLKDSIEMRKML
jgi:hypothetical protein